MDLPSPRRIFASISASASSSHVSPATSIEAPATAAPPRSAASAVPPATIAFMRGVGSGSTWSPPTLVQVATRHASVEAAPASTPVSVLPEGLGPRWSTLMVDSVVLGKDLRRVEHELVTLGGVGRV
jgi:hypothetical protein